MKANGFHVYKVQNITRKKWTIFTKIVDQLQNLLSKYFSLSSH